MAERVYVTEFPDGTLIRWKPLSWSEYRTLTRDYGHLAEKGAAVWLMFDAIGRLCILDQAQAGREVEYDDLFAGVVWTVAQKILELSGFINEAGAIRDALGQARATVYGDWYEEVKGYVMAAFRVTEEEIDSWTRDKFLRYVARAEIILGREIPVEDPNEQKGKAPVRFITDENGNRVPVVSKQNLEDRTAIDPEADNQAMMASEAGKPEGEFNLKRLRMQQERGGVKNQSHPQGQHPARIAAAQGKKVHPLRKKMMRMGMI